jgi:hypothetical protein
MRVACYDPGSKHLGETILDTSGERPRAILARHVAVSLTDDGLRELARERAATWAAHGVERVVIERVSGIGGPEGESHGATLGRASQMVGAGRVEGVIRGVALACDRSVATYTPRTVRAGLEVDRDKRAEHVRAHVDEWPADPGDDGASGLWYMHRFDAALVGLWDLRAASAEVKPKATRSPKGRRVKHKPSPRQRSRAAERAAVGCTCQKRHRSTCPLSGMYPRQAA